MKIKKIEINGKVFYSVEGISLSGLKKRITDSLEKTASKHYFKVNWKKIGKKHKEKDDCKIELSWEKAGSYRYYYYRIMPSELPLFTRWFNNPWNRIELVVYYDWNPCISADDYKKYIAPMQTYGDVKKFREGQLEKLKKERKRYSVGGYND